ncbi:UbiA prenyltransferase family protein [Winogradskyella sp. PC D3.3]
MFFNKQLIASDSLLSASLAFISFSLVASSIYCFNDIVDLEFDKQHKSKKNRVLASGLILKKEAKIGMLFCVILGLGVSYFFSGFSLFLVLASYFVLNILYTLVFKKIIVLDVMCIAASFVLRLLAGGVATHTELSYWILIMVILLALFLAFAKRRDEVVIYLEDEILVRSNIDKYSLRFLDAILMVLSFIIIILYLAYSFSSEIEAQFNNDYVWLTSIFVILGLFRYNWLIKLRRNFVNPTKILLKDKVMQFVVIGWIISFYIIIYT